MQKYQQLESMVKVRGWGCNAIELDLPSELYLCCMTMTWSGQLTLLLGLS